MASSELHLKMRARRGLTCMDSDEGEDYEWELDKIY
jgi:hypothetical protein